MTAREQEQEAARLELVMVGRLLRTVLEREWLGMCEAAGTWLEPDVAAGLLDRSDVLAALDGAAQAAYETLAGGEAGKLAVREGMVIATRERPYWERRR